MSESRIAYEEFAAAYGDFPAPLEEGTGSAVSRLFGRRIAFHKRVAGVISGLGGVGGSPGIDTGAGRYLPTVGLMRLRERVERYPVCDAGRTDPVVGAVGHGADS